jgi:hypothetical protein
MKGEIVIKAILCECLHTMAQVKGIRKQGVRHLTCLNPQCPHYGKIFKPPTVELEETTAQATANTEPVEAGK